MSQYGQVVTILDAIHDVECWNFTDGSGFTLRAGMRLSVLHAYDNRHTTCLLVDEYGQPRQHPDRLNAYRFIVLNTQLNRCAGTQLPYATEDLVGDLMAVEDGTATEEQIDRVYLNPVCSKLQGYHGRRHAAMTT